MGLSPWVAALLVVPFHERILNEFRVHELPFAACSVIDLALSNDFLTATLARKKRLALNSLVLGSGTKRMFVSEVGTFVS